MYVHSRAQLGEYDGFFDIIAAPFKAAYTVGKTAVQTAAKVAPYVAPLIPGVGPVVGGAITVGSQLFGPGTPTAEAQAVEMAEAQAKANGVYRRRTVAAGTTSLAPTAAPAVEVGTLPQSRFGPIAPAGGITIPPVVLYGGAGLVLALLLLRDRR